LRFSGPRGLKITLRRQNQDRGGYDYDQIVVVL
jgi:hypothetical protein